MVRYKLQLLKTRYAFVAHRLNSDTTHGHIYSEWYIIMFGQWLFNQVFELSQYWTTI